MLMQPSMHSILMAMVKGSLALIFTLIFCTGVISRSEFKAALLSPEYNAANRVSSPVNFGVSLFDPSARKSSLTSSSKYLCKLPDVAAAVGNM